MKFLKDNASMISRLIITHIAMSVFGLVIFLATNLQAPHIMLLASIASVAFYAVLVYTTMWEYGAKDKPAYDAGRRTGAGKCGFFSALAAESIWIVLAIVYVVLSFVNKDASLIVYTVEFLTSCCYTGIEVFLKNHVIKDSVFVPAAVYILGSVVISAVSAFGYVLGTKDLTIVPKKNNTKK